MIKHITPYLFFSGKALEAIELYKQAFGANVESIMPFQDDKTRVMHALLTIDGQRFMMSDLPAGQTASIGGNVEITLDYADAETMQQAFDVLAKTAKTSRAIKKEFWGAMFGQMTDAYNIQWMFNCDAAR